VITIAARRRNAIRSDSAPYRGGLLGGIYGLAAYVSFGLNPVSRAVIVVPVFILVFICGPAVTL